MCLVLCTHCTGLARSAFHSEFTVFEIYKMYMKQANETENWGKFRERRNQCVESKGLRREWAGVCRETVHCPFSTVDLRV